MSNELVPYTYRDYYLEHHGVKGMKWGVRKNRVSGAAKRGVKSYGFTSDKESQERTAKLLNKTGGSKGKAIIATVAVNTGKQVVAGIAMGPLMMVPVVSLGAGAATTAATVGTVARTAQDVRNIARAKR